jgi:hypothetical protein
MTLAAIKRRITIGTTLSIVKQNSIDGDGTSHFLGKRRVDGVQTNAVRFENGQYLYWPRSRHIREVEGGFQVDLAGTGDFMNIVEYQIEHEPE